MRFSPQPALFDSHAPFQPLWLPGANAQLDELCAYRMLLIERLKVVGSQLSQLAHIASLGGGRTNRASLALSKSSIDSDVFSTGTTSTRELERDSNEKEARLGQLRHAHEALRERLQATAGDEAAAPLRALLVEQLAQLEREMYSQSLAGRLSLQQQPAASLAATTSDLQANQLALSRFIGALREERELLMQQIELLTLAESRFSTVRTAAATPLYLRYVLILY